jgi:methionine-gamma-lyase
VVWKVGRGLRASTQILRHGFDPSLSVGSARPAVFRSSTYVFSSPEAAERAFNIATGRAPREAGEKVDLIYARLNHPNAEILENQIVPLETGAEEAVVFNSEMAATMTALLAFLQPGQTVIYTVPAYGDTQHLIRDFLSQWGINGIAVPAGNSELLETAIRSATNLGMVLVETPANPTLVMTDIRRACDVMASRNAGSAGSRPLVMVDNTLLGPAFQHPLALGADLVLYSERNISPA